jgi:hypothetical protein
MLRKNKLLLSFLPSIIYFVFFIYEFRLIEITSGAYNGNTWVLLSSEFKTLLSLLCIPLIVSLIDSSSIEERAKRLWHGQSYQNKKDAE